jgi:hypothetical protein
MKIAMSCEDASIRNADLANARQTLSEALADYNNPRLLSETSALDNSADGNVLGQLTRQLLYLINCKMSQLL